jgi:tetratricopeptide (TPR) repeat protein
MIVWTARPARFSAPFLAHVGQISGFSFSDVLTWITLFFRWVDTGADGMEIPSYLETQIRDGRVILFLGAGASRDAKDGTGRKAPSGNELRDLLCDRFLGGKHKDLPLDQVGDYAISESDLVTVQEYLRKLFELFLPTEAHRMMCSFRWAGLATTNYDCLIERAYECAKAVQEPVPFIENGDRVDDLMRGPRSIKLLKLHGCISKTANPDCPLILSPDQYIEHRKGRSRIFEQLREWSFEHPIVFVGHKLQDPDIRAVLLELAQLGERRPRFYVVSPTVDEIQQRIWENKRITTLKGSFLDFMHSLDGLISSSFRGIIIERDASALPISERFVRKDAPSPACMQFMTVDVDYVKGISSTENLEAVDFYKGTNRGFSAIDKDLDIRRHLGDTILADNFIIDEAQHSDHLEMIVVKAHAGAGKSVLLHRIAWDATYDYDCICLCMKPYGVINVPALQELITLCNKRLYLFVDDAADRVRELRSLAEHIGPEGKYLTVVLAERINEWNISCSPLSPFVSNSYELKYLSAKEIDLLLDKLEQHKALGTLARFDRHHRRLQLSEVAGRQLLVALHEATLGIPFEDIILDEFNHIEPHEARSIYLTICVLNRLNVPVRAGLISRIHGINFDDFQARLFTPLEHVVQTEHNPVIQDHLYRARHPHIADIVFQRVLKSPEERYATYLRFLQNMNIDYSVDLKAFRQILRAKSLAEQIGKEALVDQVFDAAVDWVGQDAYIYQQRAIYEMNRPQPDLERCSNLLDMANRLAPQDHSIKHSIAEHRLRCVDVARTPLEQQSLLRQAAEIASSLRFIEDSYAYHTLAKIGLKKVELLIKTEEDISLPALESAVNEVERVLSDASQKFPGDPYLLDAESRLAAFLADSRRVVEALKKAFDANTRSTFIAIRLAQCYRRQGEMDQAKSVLRVSLGGNPGEKRLHYLFAKVLLETGDSDDEVLYHLRRSFVAGDKNHDAQLLYARQLYITGSIAESKQVFTVLAKTHISTDIKDRILYPLAQTFSGKVVRIEAVYCFIARDGLGDWVFASRPSVGEDLWSALKWGLRVSFKLGFTFKGTSAYEIRAVSEAGTS